MSEEARRAFGVGFSLLLAAMLQLVFADPLQIKGAKPDFLLLFALMGSLFCDLNGGAALGFFAGLIHASFASSPHGGFGSLIVNRTLVSGFVGWLEERVFRDSPIMTPLFAFTGTLVAETLFYLSVPQGRLRHRVFIAVGTALYNAFLALPVYLLLRRLTGLKKAADRI